MTVPAAQNIFLVALSGVSYAEIAGNSNAPNINGYMAKYASSAAFSALAYPSEPNVLALSGGSTQGITANTYQQFSANNLLEDRILAVGKTWKVYAENLPVDPTTTSGGYSFFYNPAIFYTDNYPVNNSLIVNYTQLATDLGATPPNFGWVLPNSTHNMSGGPGSIAAGDTFVGTVVSAIQTALPNALIVLWWDSDDGTGGNQVPLVIISPRVVSVGYSSTISYTHYNLLATIEDALGVTPLGTTDEVSMDDMFAQGAAGGVFAAPFFVIPTGGGIWDESNWDQATWASAGGPPATVYLNSPFFYQFDAQGNPFPKYTVSSGQLPPGLVLDPDFGTLVGVPQSLGIFVFSVQAANSQGSVTTPPITMQVIASVAENPDNDPILLGFTDPKSASQAVDGGEYYFSVSVTTTAGTGAISAPSGAAQLIVAPQPITGLVAVAGNASASLSWTAPSDTGGSALTGYQITTRDLTLGTSAAAFYPPATGVTITGLSNGHTYAFVVQAASVDNKILSRGVASSAVTCAGTSNLISAAVPNPPANTPQPSYPQFVVSFTTLTDYPNSPPRDIGFAFNVNAPHPELVAIERIIGTNPYAGLAYDSLQEALADLAVNKANLVHKHSHSAAAYKDQDDHPQYARLDGTRAFTKPLTAPPATQGGGLVTLGQVQSYGFNLSQLSFGSNGVTGKTAASVETATVPPIHFRADQAFPWVVIGGLFKGVTAPDGLIQIAFAPAYETYGRFSSLVLSFEYLFTTIPANTSGVPYYNPQNDDIELYFVDLSHAMLYVSSTLPGPPQRFIGLSWKAVGI